LNQTINIINGTNLWINFKIYFLHLVRI
jgi:hypothetical protein